MTDDTPVHDNPDDPGAFWRPSWPKVETVAVRVRGLYYLRLTCPFCGQRHHHGGARSVAAIPLGGRVAHCAVGDGGSYVLLAPVPGRGAI